MRVLSLFDGLGGARIALNNLSIVPEVYYASEIDKYAMKVSQHNYKDIIQLGDVTKIDFNSLGRIDLLIGGSPCINLSCAGNRQGLKGEQSKLFYEYLRALKELNPKYFLLENVSSMKNTERDKISELVGVQPILINSSLVTAQQRKRYYWTNIPNITQPEDKHIYLKDILISGSVDKDKFYCIDANYYKGANLEQYLTKCRRQLVFEEPKRIGAIGKGGQGDRIYSKDGKSVSLSANGGGRGAKTGLYLINNSVTKEGSVLNNILQNELYVRKLTPIECERLQGVPDDYTNSGTYTTKTGKIKPVISDSQRYKMIGNGFTIPIIEHILKHITDLYDL
jgi:DNA-cytosine methyltransferase